MVINTPHLLDKKRAEEEFLSHFSLSSITAFGLDAYRDILPIAWAILSYVKSTQKSQLSQVTKCLPLRHEHTMSIDKVSIRNLDLISSSMTQKKTGSLFWVLDTTKTAMGARKLKFLIQNPSTDIRQINQRLDAVSALKEDLLSREELRDTLQYVYDLERLLSRIVSHRHNPKDCIALRDSLGSLEEMSGILSHFQHTPLLDSYADFFSSFSDKNSCYYLLHTLLKNSIVDSPPSHIRDGNIIKKGFNDELDALNFSFKSIRDWIDTLEEKERQSTGIKGLKVGFNKVFGYFFNIPNGSKHLVPEHYIRKQTLANAERYITPELKEKEIVLLNGEEKRIALESRIYVDIVATIQRSIRELQQLAEIIAQLDCLQSFASVSQKYNYTRPTFVESEHAHLSLNDSRHPVLEKQAESPVIPNTFSLSESESSFMLITGPNMAGKSTFMRQVALIVIMAQIGCFVPASAASLSICDKIFTRIGALDNLYSGQSTFMVEMLETSTILHNATSKSLILLDEIGRGTSTYDGMSIAGAITEYIHTRIGARTMFATHYHELTQLSQSLTNLSNYSMAIKEDGESIFFTYSLVEGPADKSYGIHVAQMAGLPGEVLERAKTLLKNYESL
jgi:DNA mismatch repair protein MutS